MTTKEKTFFFFGRISTCKLMRQRQGILIVNRSGRKNSEERKTNEMYTVCFYCSMLMWSVGSIKLKHFFHTLNRSRELLRWLRIWSEPLYLLMAPVRVRIKAITKTDNSDKVKINCGLNPSCVRHATFMNILHTRFFSPESF